MSNKQITGNTGLYYVSYIISYHGYNTAITSRNAKGADLIVYNEDCSKFTSIQVKTASKSVDFRMGKEISNVICDFWCIVNSVSDKLELPSVFILTKKEISSMVYRDECLDKSGYWLMKKYYRDNKYLEKWEKIFNIL